MKYRKWLSVLICVVVIATVFSVGMSAGPPPKDSDGDGLSDNDEKNVYGTDHRDPDTDDDGLWDGWQDLNENLIYEIDEPYGEIGDPNQGNAGGFGTDPLDTDTDDDELSDGEEVNADLSESTIVDTLAYRTSKKEVETFYSPGNKTDYVNIPVNDGALEFIRNATMDLGVMLTKLSKSRDFGQSISNVGDVNNDGYDDIAIGAPGGYPGERVYVFHGSANGISETPNTIIENEYHRDDNFGQSVSGAGDVNNDGYSDIVVGAPRFDSSHGKIYVFYGSANGVVALNTSEANNTVVNLNSFGDNFGCCVSNAGDVNNDGFNDIIVGAHHWGTFPYGRNGSAFVFHGSSSGITASNTSQANTSLHGENHNDWFGFSVSSAGNVNGDGYDDVVVGAYGFEGGSERGKIYVYHGGANGISDTPARTIVGEDDEDYFGYQVSNAGNINGDGYDDLLVSAPNFDSESYRGKVYIYHGSSSGIPSIPTTTIIGENDGDCFGGSISDAGDVDNDSYDDIIVGAPYFDENGYYNIGKVYLYLGDSSGLSVTPSNTIVGNETNDYLSDESLSSAGDIDKNGYSDIIVGSYTRNKVYVFPTESEISAKIASLPVDASLDVGNDTDIQWSHPGELTAPEITPDFTFEMNTYLASVNWSDLADGMIDGHALVPLVFHSDTRGDLKVFNISIGVEIITTDPLDNDTDNDNMTDGDEYYYGLDPTNPDTDGDELNDGDEFVHGADPFNPDTDGDGMPDGWEVNYGLDPLSPEDANGDLDNDTITNLEEYLNGLDPTVSNENCDTDGDGLLDEEEVRVYGSHAGAFINWVGYFVMDDIYVDIATEIAEYCSSVETYVGVDTKIFNGSWDRDELKNELISQHDVGMIGATLVGNPPTAWYQWEPGSTGILSLYIADLYYEDLDGIWEDTDNDGAFDTLSGDISPEIWVGQLRPPTDNISETKDMLKGYFVRATCFMNGTLTRPDRGLTYLDDDFAYDPCGAYAGMQLAYDNVTLVNDPYETNDTDYEYRLANEPYEFFSEMVHGNPYLIGFEIPPDDDGGITYSWEVHNMNQQSLFYLLNSCENGKYSLSLSNDTTRDEYMAGEYVFSNTDYGLGAISDTKVGAFEGYSYFFNRINNDSVVGTAMLGTAFLSWWQTFGIGCENSWGSVYIGDPVLRTDSGI